MRLSYLIRSTGLLVATLLLSLAPAADWTSQDIGGPGQSGSSSASDDGTATVTGGGTDIWGSSDKFHYLWQPVEGDCRITARVTSLQNTNSWAKAGLMVRETLTANSRHAFAAVRPDGLSFSHRRTSVGGSTTSTNGPTGSYPNRWVRLTRLGDQFTAEASPDGQTWTTISSQTVAMAAAVQVGLAVTSHNNSVTATATFEDVHIDRTVDWFGQTAWARKLYDPISPALSGIAIDGTVETVTDSGSGDSHRFATLQWQGDSQQSGVRNWAANTFAFPAGSNRFVGVDDFSVQVASQSGGSWNFSKKLYQDSKLVAAWFRATPQQIQDLMVHGDGFSLDVPLPYDALVLHLAFRHSSYGQDIWNKANYSGNPPHSAVVQVTAGQSISQAMGSAANRLSALGPLVDLTKASDRVLCKLQVQDNGQWQVLVDYTGDGTVDADIVSGIDGNLPYTFADLDESAGLVVSTVTASGAGTGQIGHTTIDVSVEPSASESVPNPPRSLDPLFLDTFPDSSLTSPVFLAGRRFAAGRQVTIAASTLGPVPVAPVALDTLRFYQDVPLSAGSPVVVTLEQDQGPTIVTKSQGIAWTPTVITTGSPSLSIRQGDSLLVDLPAGITVEVRQGGALVASLGTGPGQAAYQFATAGDFDLVRSDGPSRSVSVVGVDIPALVLAQVGSTVAYEVGSSHPSQVVLQSADSANLQLTDQGTTATGRAVDVKPLAGGQPQILARLGSVGGPIIAAGEVTEFEILNLGQHSMHYTDATQTMAEARLIVRPHIPDLFLDFHMSGSQATFIGGDRDMTISTSGATVPPDNLAPMGVATVSIYDNPLTGEPETHVDYQVELNGSNGACLNVTPYFDLIAEVIGFIVELVGAQDHINPCIWECVIDPKVEFVEWQLDWDGKDGPPLVIGDPNPAPVGLPAFITFTASLDLGCTPGLKRCDDMEQEVPVKEPFIIEWILEREPAAPPLDPNGNPCVPNPDPVQNPPALEELEGVMAGVCGINEFDLPSGAPGDKFTLRLFIKPNPEQECPWDEFTVRLRWTSEPPTTHLTPGRPIQESFTQYLSPSVKYTGVDIHGIPIAAPGPTGEGESDREPNRTYVDMYDLQLRYGVTDLALPVEGGELVNEVRRNAGNSSVKLSDKPQLVSPGYTYASDTPLGMGWSTNVGARIIVTGKGLDLALQGLPTHPTAVDLSAEVRDENGSIMAFRSRDGQFWQPDVRHSFGNEASTISLQGDLSLGTPFVMRRVFGTELVFDRVAVAKDATLGICGSRDHLQPEVYFRLASVEDRNGNKLIYGYANAGTLPGPNLTEVQTAGSVLPTTVHEELHPERVLTLNWTKLGGSDAYQTFRETSTDHFAFVANMSPWRLESVTDPHGNDVLYTYDLRAADGSLYQADRPAHFLVSVTETGLAHAGSTIAPVVDFDYVVLDKEAIDPNGVISTIDPGDFQAFIHSAVDRHAAVNFIRAAATMTIDPDSGSRVLDRHETSLDYELVEFLASVGNVTGRQRFSDRLEIRSLTSMDGTARFLRIDESHTAVEDTARVAADGDTTIGCRTDYTFVGTSFTIPPDPLDPTGNSLLAQTITHVHRDSQAGGLFEAGQPGGDTRRVTYQFYEDTNANLELVTDMSGNKIHYEYSPSGPLLAQINHGQPTRRVVFMDKASTDPNDPQHLETTYEYGTQAQFFKLVREVDAEGMASEFDLDALGNRIAMRAGINTAEAIPIPMATTLFVYDTVDPAEGLPPAIDAQHLALITPLRDAQKPGRLVATIDPDGRLSTSTRTFNPVDLQAYCVDTSVTYGIPGENLGITTQSVMDVLGNVRTTIDGNGNQYTSDYDYLNRPVASTKPAVEDPDNPGSFVTSTALTAYDGVGNVTETTDHEGNKVVSSYDLLNRPVRIRQVLGNPANAAIRQPEDLITTSFYDELGLLAHAVSPKGNETKSLVELNAPITAGTSADFRTSHTYDGLLRKVQTTFPLVDDSTVGTTRYVEQYRYEFAGNPGAGSWVVFSGWNPTEVVDRRGNITRFEFDAIYRQTAVENLIPAGEVAQVGHGNPRTETAYNRVHNPISVTVINNTGGGAGNETTHTFYDHLHRATVSSFDIDGDGPGLAPDSYVLSQVAPSEVELRPHDHPHPSVGAPSQARGLPDSFSFAPVAGLDGDDHVSRTRYDAAGNVIAVADANGVVTRSFVDGAGRLSLAVGAAVSTVENGHAASGVPAFIGTARPVTATYFDDNSNAVIAVDARGTASLAVYDARNRTTQTVVDLDGDGIFEPAFEVDPLLPVDDITTGTAFDFQDNVVRVTDPRGNLTANVYDRIYRVDEVHEAAVADGENGGVFTTPITRTIYDAHSNVVEVQDPRGVLTRTSYDGLDRARTVTEAFGTVDAVTSESQYDANNNVIALTMHNEVLGVARPQRTEYQFDFLNRQISEVLPIIGDGLTRQTVTTYHQNGIVKAVTDPKGQTIETVYDRKRRALTKVLRRSDTTIEETRSFAYDRVDNLLIVTDLHGTTTNTYDDLYRIVNEARADTGHAAYAVASSYDLNGNRGRCVYPETNRTLDSGFDRLNRHVVVTEIAGTTTFVFDAVSNRRSSTKFNGVVDEYAYDAQNRLVSCETHNAANVLIYEAGYEYDLMDNRVAIDEFTAGLGDRDLRYVYDDQYRLTQERWNQSTVADPMVTELVQYDYAYDPAGNRLSLVHQIGTTTTTTTYTYDDLNRLVQHVSGAATADYTYDLNGNRQTKTVTAQPTQGYVWDVSDRLVAVDDDADGATDFEASYDYRTRRLIKREGVTTTYFRYDQGVSFHEIEGGALQVEFIRANGMGGGIGSIIYADRLSTAELEFFCYNPVGHTVALTDQVGILAKSDWYAAFGQVVRSQGASKNNRLANTKEKDASTGLYCHGFRYYDQEIGRYLSTDPLGYTDGLNLYAYVGNNPVGRIDALGLKWRTKLSGKLRGGRKAWKQATKALGDKLQGGAYGVVRRISARLNKAAGRQAYEVHHMPASGSHLFGSARLSHRYGPSIVMEAADHQKTLSWGSSREAKVHRATQVKLIQDGRWEDALQMDINDIRKQFGNKYDGQIEQMQDYVNHLKEGGVFDAMKEAASATDGAAAAAAGRAIGITLAMSTGIALNGYEMPDQIELPWYLSLIEPGPGAVGVTDIYNAISGFTHPNVAGGRLTAHNYERYWDETDMEEGYLEDEERIHELTYGRYGRKVWRERYVEEFAEDADQEVEGLGR